MRKQRGSVETAVARIDGCGGSSPFFSLELPTLCVGFDATPRTISRGYDVGKVHSAPPGTPKLGPIKEGSGREEMQPAA